jgi:hypothetical protein
MQKTYLSLPDIQESDNFVIELSSNSYALAFNIVSIASHQVVPQPDSSSW